MSLGFYIDMQRCIGCKTCQVACKDRHNLQLAGPRPRRVDSFESGAYPAPGVFHTVISCNHCESPACVANCPQGAMFKDEATGVVLHDDEKCIKCETCVKSCPYGAPQVAEELDGLIVKCDTCLALREAGHNPVCVDACPMRAIEFGELDELRSKHGEGLVSELPCLPEAGETGANLLLKANSFSLAEDFEPVAL